MIQVPDPFIVNWMDDEIDFSTLTDADRASRTVAAGCVIEAPDGVLLDDLAEAFLAGEGGSDIEPPAAQERSGTDPDPAGAARQDGAVQDGFDFT